MLRRGGLPHLSEMCQQIVLVRFFACLCLKGENSVPQTFMVGFASGLCSEPFFLLFTKPAQLHLFSSPLVLLQWITDLLALMSITGWCFV